MANPLTFVIVPTFKEPRHVERLLNCFAHADNRDLVILIVNGNPGDDTSKHIERLHIGRILELQGHPGLFWSGLVNLGLQYILRQEHEPEFVILMNADVEFDHHMLSRLIVTARTIPDCQLAAVTLSNRTIITSGVKVISWLLTLNRHPLAGVQLEDLPADTLIPVDFLPARCTLIPFTAVRQAGLVAEKSLPHYGADNEYTNRLRKLGWQPFIYTGSQVRLDAQNTGSDVFHKRLPFRMRVGSLFSIKSTSNPMYRLRFIRLTYPIYAWPSAMLLYALRTFLEVLLGGSAIKLLFPQRESGFSGS
jgi:GT2 family glycosyltransferase